MFFIKKIKSLIKFLIIIFTYPYTFFYVFLTNEKKIYNNIFKLYFSSDSKKIFKSNLNNLLRYAFDTNYYFYPKFLKKKYIKSSMGDPEEGVITAKYYRAKGFPDKDFESNFAYKYLIDYIKFNKFNKLHIHQIGASSGSEINYFSKFSDSIIFEASDISKEIIENIKSNYSNLICSVVDLSEEKNFIPVAKRCSLIVAFGGLQYLLPEDLEKFFKISKLEKCELIISQPLCNLFDPFKMNNSIPRGNLSWSHSYLKIASKLGYRFNSSVEYNSNQKAKMLYAHFF